jgi:hypothetical protein
VARSGSSEASGQEPVAPIDSAAQEQEQAPEAPASAPCDAAALLFAIDQAGPAPAGLYWASVDIAECQNGFARVFAITGGTPPPGTNLEGSEQVFLRDVDGAWEVFDSGSGLDCVSEPLGPDMQEACQALGLS